MSGLCASIGAALFAWCIGADLGVPVWSTANVGDRTDLAVLAFFTVRWTIAAIREANPAPIAKEPVDG